MYYTSHKEETYFPLAFFSKPLICFIHMSKRDTVLQKHKTKQIDARLHTLI